jgi:cytochrome c oxidase assembly protein subunit 15
MDGRIVPEGYGFLKPFYLNFFENIPAVQFNHRLLATLTAAAAGGVALTGLRVSAGAARTVLVGLTLAVALQYALGVVTLLWAVPAALGTAHQAMAMVVLTLSLAALHIHTELRADREVL